MRLYDSRDGEMSEWLKEHAWKACVGETLPWVRIPLSPPTFAHAQASGPDQRLRGMVDPHAKPHTQKLLTLSKPRYAKPNTCLTTQIGEIRHRVACFRGSGPLEKFIQLPARRAVHSIFFSAALKNSQWHAITTCRPETRTCRRHTTRVGRKTFQYSSQKRQSGTQIHFATFGKDPCGRRTTRVARNTF